MVVVYIYLASWFLLGLLCPFGWMTNIKPQVVLLEVIIAPATVCRQFGMLVKGVRGIKIGR